MKKTFLFGLFLAAAFFANSQGNTLYRVDVVKPKAGMQSAFEASWKLHMSMYHKATDKRTVYEVVSGPDLGSYVIVEGPFSFASMDTVKPNSKAHGLDLDRNFTPKLDPGSNNFMARWVDTLSRNFNTYGEKLFVTTTVVKNGKMDEYLSETRRTVLIQDKMNSTMSISRHIKQFAGSSPTLISVRILKDGYKELEGPQNPQFRTTYINVYGQEAWDNRLKILVDDVVSSDSHFEILRADLSSK